MLDTSQNMTKDSNEDALDTDLVNKSRRTDMKHVSNESLAPLKE